MRRTRALRVSPAVWAWTASLAALALLAWRRPVIPVALNWIAAAAVPVALLATWLVATGRVSPLLRQRLPTMLAAAAAPIYVLALLTGGIRSPAVPLFALLVLGFSWRVGPWTGTAIGALLVALMAITDHRLIGFVDPASVLSLAGLVLGAGVLPALHARRRVVEGMHARQQLARVEGYLDRRMTPHAVSAVVTDLRDGERQSLAAADGLRHLEELDRYLRDVRDLIGADEVVFWKFRRSQETLIPVAWSTEQTTTPQYFQYEAWAPLVKWTAEGEVAQCIVEGAAARFVVAPVVVGSKLLGVLSASSSAGLTLAPEGAKHWLGRHATQVGLLANLLEVRGEYALDRRHIGALLQAAQQIQTHKSAETLGEAICETALQVTSADRVALLRWSADQQRGTVLHASRGHPLTVGALIEDSVIAALCAEGQQLVQTDARAMGRAGRIYGPGEPRRELGALIVVPLRTQHAVLGAIAIESDDPDRSLATEAQNLSLLAAVAAGSLELTWDLEEVTRRALTDQLTGLYNRRHFDEQLKRVLREADRFGNPASLVVADVDFFKKVNDTYGHDGGDAVLRQVARVFIEEARSTDICARYGGEEIAILLPQTTLAGASELAERLRRAVERQRIPHDGRQIAVTASFGVAAYPESVRTQDGLFAAADKALYQAKSAGRNCVKLAQPMHYPTKS